QPGRALRQLRGGRRAAGRRPGRLRAPARAGARRRSRTRSEPAARQRDRAAPRPPSAGAHGPAVRGRARRSPGRREDALNRLRMLALAAAAWLAAAALPSAATAQGGRPVTIKLASFVPEGSIWDKNLRQMGDAWRRATDGRVALTVFAGGQQGEESTVVAKM